MTLFSKLIFALALAIFVAAPVCAQNHDNPFLLKRGDNEFAWVGEAGGGVRIFTSERRAVNVGVRFHHISNGDRQGSNRGLNQFVIYAGFSIFR